MWGEVGFEWVAGVVFVSLATCLHDGGVGVFLVEAKHHGDEGAAGAASGIADGVSGLGIEHFHHGGDDVTRGAELPADASGGELAEQVLVDVAFGIAFGEREFLNGGDVAGEQVVGRDVTVGVLEVAVERVDRLDMTRVQPFGLLSAGVVENEENPFAIFPGGFFDHGIEERLEDFRIAVRNDEADELAACGVHRADEVPAQMSAMVALNGTGAAFHPFLARPGIVLEARFIAEEDFAGRIGEKIQQFGGEALALALPGFVVGRLGHAGRAGVAVFVKVAVEDAVSQVELFFLAEVAAEFCECPMGLAGQRRIVHNGEDQFGDNVGRELPAPAASRPINEAVDTKFVEARDPEAEGAFAHPAVAQDDFVGGTDQEEMDRVEAAVGFAVQATIQRPLQLLKAAGIRVR